jgi:hypothetical protein
MKEQGSVHRELYYWYIEYTEHIKNQYSQFITDWTYNYYYDGTKLKNDERTICKYLLEKNIKIGDPYSQAGKFYIQAYLKRIKESK